MIQHLFFGSPLSGGRLQTSRFLPEVGSVKPLGGTHLLMQVLISRVRLGGVFIFNLE